MQRLILLSLVVLVGCDSVVTIGRDGRVVTDDNKEGGEGEGEGEVVPPPPPPPTMKVSGRGDLVWKRQRAVERDLMQALELTRDELCNELGQYNCVDTVHIASLGGNEPFEKGQLVPASVTTATTSLTLDRIALAACTRRVDLDALGPAVVFTDSTIDAQVNTLYRRFHARDAIADELAVAADLAVDDTNAALTARDQNILLCFAIATTIEAVFY